MCARGKVDTGKKSFARSPMMSSILKTNSLIKTHRKKVKFDEIVRFRQLELG